MTDNLTQEEIDIGIRAEDKGGDENIPLLDTTKCALPLIHLHTWPNKNVFACCLGGYDTKIGSLEDGTLEEIFNNDMMKDIRKKMLNNERPRECTNCFKEEDTGGFSFRKTANRDFKHHLDKWDDVKEDGTLEKMDLAYWDFRFSNVCSFSCRSCGPQLSSGWYKDTKKMYGSLNFEDNFDLIKERTIEVWDQLEPHFDTVERIYFAGGEPLMMEEHYRILKRLIKMGRSEVVLIYNTNLSTLNLKKDSVLDLWPQFDRVVIEASLDGSGERGEFVRKGLVWEEWKENRKQIEKACPNIEFNINYTISIQNVLHVRECMEELIDIKAINSPHNFRFNLVHHPVWLNVIMLPDYMKQKIKDYMEDWKLDINKDYPKIARGSITAAINSFLDYMFSEPGEEKMIQLFCRQMELIDSVRNECWQEAIPEMACLDPTWKGERKKLDTIALKYEAGRLMGYEK